MKEKKRRLQLVMLSLVVSVLLMSIKFAAYYLTGSKAILTDALESIINVVAAGFAYYSIYLSSKPKDENHPYGHGKIEFFSAGFEGALIGFAGLFMIVESVQAFFNPNDLQGLPLGALILSSTIFVNVGLGYLLKKEGEKQNSLTLKADGQHLLVDALSSTVIVIGAFLIYFTNYFVLDSVFSILFALYILFNGYRLVRQSVAGLMDEVDPKTFNKVVKALNNHRRKNWIDVHNLRIQKYGADLHVDCHLTLPFYFNLETVHDEIQLLEECLESISSHNVEVFTHADPCIPGKCCAYCRVTDCVFREEESLLNIPWNKTNLGKNQKHYLEISQLGKKK
ncbi:cation diffusion facilitator family transporter [Xanthovirga aplysinae]|uniref:cation diffusion facilitator family transporter n=1 Tax=Xanthovirga aplysinae TaxID=2529853 RepID=UPI0012BC3C3D|nr:cation diffusion facilitator family transporter [Xanthovirga aplysinae]MTI32245.1 cation transporter [Xanthovirga aplysinae]